jgi:hypothetical protein
MGPEEDRDNSSGCCARTHLRVEPGVVVGDPLSLGQGGFVLIVEADDFAFLRGGEPVGADGSVFLRGGVREVIRVVACHIFNVVRM